MKKILVALMALTLVGVYSCEKDPEENNNNGTPTPIEDTTSTPQDTTSTPQDTTSTPQDTTSTTAETFIGNWDLAFAEDATVHLTATFSEMAQSYMQMENVDEDISLLYRSMGFEITEAGNNQVTIVGSITLELMDGVDPVTFDFTTTGTITDNGLVIETAQIDNTFEYMQAITINLSGSVEFAQPTPLPEDGILSVVISSLNVTGSDASNMIVDITLNGTQIHSSGPRF